MKILFDHQIFEMQRFGGISNMYVNIIGNLPPSVSYTISVKDCDNIHLKESHLKKTGAMQSFDNFITEKRFKGKRLLYNTIEKYYPSIQSSHKNLRHSIKLLEEGDYDIFHPTFFDDYFIPHLHGKPFVLTIYDMISELFFEKNDFQTIKKRELVQSAAHIVAISEKTKEDIINILHVDESKISVVYLAVPDISLHPTSPIITGNYILFVGNRGGYKNFLPMFKSIAPLLQKHQEIKLVCTGNPFNETEKNTIKYYNLSEQVIHIHPSDKEIRNLYSHALCFIFPSLYEGFGIPILEAWQCNCPVLLNKKSCFPEIADDAALYFDPNNESEISKTVEKLIVSESLRKELVLKGSKRFDFFSMDNFIKNTYNVYQKTIG